jgi:hypothetical protein
VDLIREGDGEGSSDLGSIRVDFIPRFRYTTIGPSSSSDESSEGRGDGEGGGQFLVL